MRQESRKAMLEILRRETVPALGCTEPVAAALCAAGAAAQLPGSAEKVELEASEYILKNAMNVGIPGVSSVGLEMACALGAASGAPEKGLLVLEGLSEEQKACARELSKRVRVSKADTAEKVYLRAVASCQGHKGEAVISGSHSHFSKLMKDGQVVSSDETTFGEAKQDTAGCPGLTVENIWEFIQETAEEELSFLDETITLNKAVAQEGLRGDYGLRVGQSILKADVESLFGRSLANRAAAAASAAADARMSGCEKPVMSVAGSGNQGLTATLPVIVLAEEGPASFREKERRALALSILVTVHAKEYLGKLSVLCGCSIAAAIGVTVAVVYLYGGTREQAELGIKTMTADISGMICDGAKPGCALKIATSVEAAMRAANMALAGHGANSHDGIVDQDVENTLKNLGDLGTLGMGSANLLILDMLLKKQRQSKE